MGTFYILGIVLEAENIEQKQKNRATVFMDSIQEKKEETNRYTLFVCLHVVPGGNSAAEKNR